MKYYRLGGVATPAGYPFIYIVNVVNAITEVSAGKRGRCVCRGYVSGVQSVRSMLEVCLKNGRLARGGRIYSMHLLKSD